MTTNIAVCQTSFGIGRMTTTNLDAHSCQLEDNKGNSNYVNKSKESLIQREKDGSLPHQDHGYAWFIVLGK